MGIENKILKLTKQFIKDLLQLSVNSNLIENKSKVYYTFPHT